MAEQALLRPTEAAARLAVSRSKVYELIKAGQLPGVLRIGSSYRISVRALDAWIEQSAGPKSAA